MAPTPTSPVHNGIEGIARMQRSRAVRALRQELGQAKAKGKGKESAPADAKDES